MKKLTAQQKTVLLTTLKKRFEKNKHRHPLLDWNSAEEKLDKEPSKLWSLQQMEVSGGEPNVIFYNETSVEYTFCDCAAESPKGRRSGCYDRKALNDRKAHKPSQNVIDAAKEMGVKLLNKEEYRALQMIEPFDQKTSSWIETPEEIRDLGGALFADFRYNHVFVYHNGASSYYASRGFRASLNV